VTTTSGIRRNPRTREGWQTNRHADMATMERTSSRGYGDVNCNGGRDISD
jgi:hypothetical protein